MPETKTINGINITIVNDKKEMSQLVAEIVLDKINSSQKINLLVPTGTTPEGIYEILSNQNGKVFSNVTFFNLDEYGYFENDDFKLLPRDHPASYKRYMDEHLFSKLSPAPKHYFPDIENVKIPGSYDKLIESFGGIDLCINAIGEDGHIFGFNSPFAKFDSVTRLVKMTKDTKTVNQGLTGLEIPNYAISTGMKTGMASKEILFIICGKRKADILKKVIYSSEPTEEIPASLLIKHPNCHWIVDKEAASKL
jgi:glucosamine-6-phosphate deaminase